MVIFGEYVISGYREIEHAIEKRDEVFLVSKAERLVKAGANYLMINHGSIFDKASDALSWVINVTQKAVSVPLCFTIPDSNILEMCLGLCHQNPIINSVSAENDPLSMFALAAKYRSQIVCSLIDDKGIPENAEQRFNITKVLINHAREFGIPIQNIYIDPLITPICTNNNSGKEALRAISIIKSEFPEVNIICDFSNISFGLPNPVLINSTFLIQLMTVGTNGFIFNPLQKEILAHFNASRMLLGQDPFCKEYLTAYRNGLL